MDDRIPPFLTVEEAARLLKIGRTKAYLLTQEYRATGGRSGLPVVDLGDLLRVPGPAIEHMLGIGLDAALPDLGKPAAAAPVPNPVAGPPVAAAVPATPVPTPVAPPTAAAVTVPASPARRPRRQPTDQLPLFQTPTRTNPEPLTTTSPTDPQPTTAR